MSVAYFDTSALVKLVRHEPGTDALRHWLATRSGTIATSVVADVELRRAVRRVGDSVADPEHVLSGVAQISLTRPIIERAGLLAQVTLRSLDAIHLATALEIGDDLSELVAYDVRLLEAAALAGIRVHTPV